MVTTTGNNKMGECEDILGLLVARPSTYIPLIYDLSDLTANPRGLRITDRNIFKFRYIVTLFQPEYLAVILRT